MKKIEGWISALAATDSALCVLCGWLKNACGKRETVCGAWSDLGKKKGDLFAREAAGVAAGVVDGTPTLKNRIV